MKRLRVLLIEDDLLDAKMIGDMLKRFDRSAFEIKHVTTVQAAFSHIAHETADVVLLDLSLPDATGLDAMSPLRATMPDTPILVLTGNDDQELALAAVKNEAQDYLVKWTFDSQLLARSIRHAVERQRIQSELASAKQAAEVANRGKSEFLANISHELRTPLTAVLGMAELLSETSLDHEQTRYLQTLQKAGTHLIGLIDDVLDLGRIESGSLTIESAPFDLTKTLHSVIEFLAVRARAKHLDLRLAIDGAVPQWVNGDSRRLRQVLVNLIGNAIKFTERGAVELAVNLIDNRLKFQVADTGIGIPPDKLERIFDRFAQADASISRTRGGSGLGLAITRPLVNLMGGELSVESRLEEGTTFRFDLPANATLPVEKSGPHRIIPIGTPRTLRILIADDAEDNRWLFATYLKQTPHQVDVVADGSEAIKAFEAKLPVAAYDIVLLDMHMPGVDGPTAATTMRRLEKQHGRASTPILAITADALTNSLDMFLSSGCTAYLTKPFSKDDLLRALAQFTSHSEAAAATEMPTDAKQSADRNERIRVDVDRELYRVMPRFLGNRRADVGKILAALDHRDFGQVWTIGHNMKGSAAGYHLPSLGELGAALANAAKLEDVVAIANLAAELQTRLDRIDVVCPDLPPDETRPSRPKMPTLVGGN